MAKRYQVTGVKAIFGPGFVLELTEGQAQPRLSNLRKLGQGRYSVTTPVEFKQGEVIGTDIAIPKTLGHKLTPVDQDDGDEAYKIRHKGSGRYDVVDAKGELVTDRLLSKEEAESLVGKLTAEENP